MPHPPRHLRSHLLPRLAALAGAVPTPLWLAARPALAAALRRAPGWSARVEAAMAAALGDALPHAARKQAARAYFDHLSDLIAFGAAVWRCGLRDAGLERFREHDPASWERYSAALAQGRGALMVCPHLVGHEIMAGSLAPALPITALVRRSPDPRYEALKQAWYAALGIETVYRPGRGASGGRPAAGGGASESLQAAAEITAALRVLRRNRVLALTPDLLQKPGRGVPVRLFGRRAELPAGPFFLAVRAGAPLLPSFFHWESGRYRLWSHEPLAPPPGTEREAAVAALAQQWADLFEAFLRAHPDMWQFWLDKRWSAWLSRPPEGPPPLSR